MATRTIGTPRFYCDIPSYLRSIGKYYGVRTTGLATPEEPNQEKVYNMNPYKPNEFDGGDSHSWASFRFFINQDVVDTNSQIFIEHRYSHSMNKNDISSIDMNFDLLIKLGVLN